MRALTAPTTLAMTLVTVLLLGGCAASESEIAEANPSESTASLQTDPPQAVEELEVGAPLTAEQAKELNGKAGTKRPYQQNDGSFIVIDVKQPLPESAKAEVAERLGSVGNDVASTLGQLDRETFTGKTIILVRQLQMGDGNGNSIFGWAAASYASGFPGFQGDSAEDVAAQAQAWANEQRDPTQLEVVIVPN